MFLPLVVAVLALIGTFAFFGAVNLVAEIDARGEDAAKFDSVRFHTHYNDRVFINVNQNPYFAACLSSAKVNATSLQ